MLVALLSAVLAAALIYLFVTHYNKNAVQQPLAPVQATVWVATRAIPQGTPESAIASGGYFKATQIPVTQAVAGAISDPSQVVGQVTASTIAAGQQITSTEFARASTSLTGDIRANQRAVAFSFDSEHGLTTWLAAGDTVDIMLIKGNKSEMVEQNVTVLMNAQGLVVLKLTDKQALLLTAASTQGSLWMTLRPALGAKNSVKIYSVGS